MIDKLANKFEPLILEWERSTNENITYIAYVLAELAIKEQADFNSFVWASLTSGQQDIAKVKYHLANNRNKPFKQLKSEVESLTLNNKFIRSNARIRNLLKYDIPVIIDKINYNSNIT